MEHTAKQRRAFIAFANALGQYLEAVGWRAVVVGSPRIQDEDITDMRYQFVIDFSGGKKAAPAPFDGEDGSIVIPLRARSRAVRGGWIRRRRRLVP